MAGVPAELHDSALTRYAAPQGLTLKHWEGEATALARLVGAGSTHLIEAEALAVIDAAAAHPGGVSLREIAHALAIDQPHDPEVEAALQGMIDGLTQSGLLRRVDDETNLGPKAP